MSLIRGIRTTIVPFLLFRRRFLGSQFRGTGVASGQEGVDHLGAVRTDLVAVRFRDFVDQTMSTQQTQSARDASRLLTLLHLVLGLGEQ